MTNLICKICGYVGKSKQGFNTHITHKHHTTSKDYYDEFLKQLNDGICPSCGKNTTFRDMWYGYNKHCSTKCIPLDPAVQEAMKETCQNRYGVDHVFQSESVKQKSAETVMKHFGVKSYLQTPEARRIIAENSRSEDVRNKIMATTLSRYDVPHAFQAEEVKQRSQQTLLDRYGVDNPAKSSEIRRRACRTATKNGKRSSLEVYLKNALIAHNISFIEEHKDSRYPYHCDFYLPDTDTFIEINGCWHHGKHWFGSCVSDVETLESWKSKSGSQYVKAIYTWTVADTTKRSVAKKNKLNYVVLWNYNDIKEWIASNFEIRQDY